MNDQDKYKPRDPSQNHYKELETANRSPTASYSLETGGFGAGGIPSIDPAFLFWRQVTD